MKDKIKNLKDYVRSDRYGYMAIGILIGWLLSWNEPPLNFILVLIFMIACVILSWHFTRKSKR